MAEQLEVKELDQVVVRFSGDSGDGMQLAGNSRKWHFHIPRLSRRHPRPARFADGCLWLSGSHRCRQGLYPWRQV